MVTRGIKVMKTKFEWSAIVVGCCGMVGAAFMCGRAQAGGIPAAGALVYSGLLQDASGAPLSGTQYVEVKFWNHATAGAAVNLLCDTGTPGLAPLTNGQFSIPLPDKCTTQVSANSGIWAEVLVGSKPDAAASLGRAKLGAVPFAVEANHAARADTSTTADSAAAAAMLTGSVKSGLLTISTNCVSEPGDSQSDCACPAGSYAISGGGFMSLGSIYETANKFTSDNTRDLKVWRVRCRNVAGDATRCDNAYALCLAVTP
jgi:hypothetical protein